MNPIWSAPIFWSTSRVSRRPLGPHPYSGPRLGLVGDLCRPVVLPLPAGRELRGRLLSERPMGPLPVVFDPPRLDGLARLFQRREPVLVETFVSESAVERLDEGVVGWLAGATEDELHAALVAPGIQRFGNELGAIVHAEALRATARGRDPLQERHHMRARQRRPGLHGRAHPANVIH